MVQVPLFDYIIIGGGTAGCVLANRLSGHDPNISILVLEAGRDHNDNELVYTPGLSTSLLGNDDFDWRYVAEPNPGLNGRQIKHPRGRLVGGSSAINSFALIYPSAAGMDAWADLGNKGWDWQGMQPYFTKFQTIHVPDEKTRRDLGIPHDDDENGQTDGPIEATFPLRVKDLQQAWVETWRALGLDNKSDPRFGRGLGGYTSSCHITADRHERSHAGVAYYEPARSRTNLTLVQGAWVTKILFDRNQGDAAQARAVSYSKDGKDLKARVGKSVILAAGTIATPQILELSGIGDPQLLAQHGIPVVYANTNVGENLQDHLRAGISLEAVDTIGPREPLSPEEARRQYQEHRTGPLAENSCFTFAYQPLAPFLNEPERKELGRLFDKYLGERSSDYESLRNDFIRAMVESPHEATATTYFARKPATDSAKGNYVSLFSMLSHTFSRGSVHITSPDVTVKPKLDFNYYSHPLDLEIHARHVMHLEKILRTEPVASYVKPGGKMLPEGYNVSSVEEAKELARANSTTNYHPCGTCSMMPEEMGGVVDDRLKVYGMQNVRVVDASIMPIIPRGNIVTTVYAVAEKAADLLIEELTNAA